MDITKLKQQWEEWKGDRDGVLWPDTMEGFDDLLTHAAQLRADAEQIRKAVGALDGQATLTAVFAHVIANDAGKDALAQLQADKDADTKRMEAATSLIRELRTDKEKAERRIAVLQIELDAAQLWRERHSKDAEAYGKQSQANWERAEKAEKACAEKDRALERIREAGQHLVGGKVWDSHTGSIAAEALSSPYGQGYVSREEFKPIQEALNKAAEKCKNCNGSGRDHDGEGWLDTTCPDCQIFYDVLARLQKLVEGKA